MKNISTDLNIRNLQNEIIVLNDRYNDYIKMTGKFVELKAIRLQLKQMLVTLNELSSNKLCIINS